MSDKLFDVFSEVLGISPEELTDDTSPENTAKWDSLASMHLVTAIEDTFDVQLSTREIMKMRTIGIARTVLRTKGVPSI